MLKTRSRHEVCFSNDNLSAVWSLSGSAGISEGLPAEGDGGQVEADGDQQRHPEPAAVPHAEGEGGDQPGAGRSAGQRSARWENANRSPEHVQHIHLFNQHFFSQYGYILF